MFTAQKPLRMSRPTIGFHDKSVEHCRSRTHTATKEKGKSLDALHAELQDEAQKMVRWKVTTEVHLDQKERQVDELQRTVRMLRNNLMEQQLSSEHLSQSLLRERAHREQVDSKVEITRHMCNGLQQQQDELQLSVQHFSEIRRHMASQQEETTFQVQSLTHQFNELTTAHQKTVQDLKSKASSEIESLRNDISTLDKELKDKVIELETVTQKCEIQGRKIVENENKIAVLESDLERTVSEKSQFSKQLEETQTSLEEVSKELSKQIKESDDKILSLQISLAAEREKLAESKSEFEEAVGKIQYLKKYSDTLEGSKEELSQQLETIKEKKQELELELAAVKNRFEDFSQDAKQHEAVLRGQISYLEEKINDLNSLVDNEKLEKEKLVESQKALVSQLESDLKSAELKQNCLTADIVQKTEYTLKLQQQLGEQENQIKVLHAVIENNEKSIESLETLKEELQNKLHTACKETVDLKSQLLQSKRAYEDEKNHSADLSENLTDANLELEKVTKTLKSSEESYVVEKTALQCEIEELNLKYKDISEAYSNSNEVLKALLEKIKYLEESKQTDTTNTESLKEEVLGLTESVKQYQLDAVSLKQQMEDVRAQYVSQTEALEKANKQLMENSENSDTLKTSVQSLEKELNSKQGTLKEAEKELKSVKRSLTCELKKTEKLKARIENLEGKLKNKETDSKSAQENMSSELENLKLQKERAEATLEQMKQEAEEKEELRKNLQKDIEAKTAALEDAEKIARECRDAKLDAESKIKEVVSLMEDFQKDNETNMKEKDAEVGEIRQELSELQQILQQNQATEVALRNERKQMEESNDDLMKQNMSLHEQLTAQIAEMDKLKTALKTLTSSPKVSFATVSESPLKTPSPSKYLPFVRSEYGQNRIPLIQSTRDNIPLQKTCLKTPVNTFRNAENVKQSNTKTSSSSEGQPKKNVSFLSPSVYLFADSDSSVDGLAIEFGSDTDDRFEAVKRSTNVRQGIPQANIQPIPRKPVVKTRSFQSAAKQQPQKKARFDKSFVKTYTSPRAGIKKMEGDKDTAKQSFESVFSFSQE